ncbi:hypothetical protein V6N12_059101 [Hibiscus sabdariffa]|uniref:Uncharacterized protein n=1 Tax=Hibiscus sabdariffa TaxID=183260 RepID=A0ABR2EU50_9ROSI
MENPKVPDNPNMEAFGRNSGRPLDVVEHVGDLQMLKRSESPVLLVNLCVAKKPRSEVSFIPEPNKTIPMQRSEHDQEPGDLYGPWMMVTNSRRRLIHSRQGAMKPVGAVADHSGSWYEVLQDCGIESGNVGEQDREKCVISNGNKGVDLSEECLAFVGNVTKPADKQSIRGKDRSMGSMAVEVIALDSEDRQASKA